MSIRRNFHLTALLLAGWMFSGASFALVVDEVPEEPQAVAEEQVDVGLQIVQDYINHPGLAGGEQVGPSVRAAGEAYYDLVRSSLVLAQNLENRIDPYDVRATFDYRKYWHTLHLLDQRTLDVLAGSWAVGDSLDVSWAYGYRVVRYRESSLVLDEKGQVLAVMVRVRQPGELQRYPIFLSQPYLDWYLKDRPRDEFMVADLIFLGLLEASTTSRYTLVDGVQQAADYTGRSTRLVVDSSPDYYPAIFYVDYVDTGYRVHPIYYDVYYEDCNPWWPYESAGYSFYYSYYNVWPRYHPRSRHYGQYYKNHPVTPYMVSGREPRYDHHVQRYRSDTVSRGRRDVAELRSPSGGDRTRTDRSREVSSVGRGVGAPTIGGEGRGIGAPTVSRIDRSVGAPTTPATRSRATDSGRTVTPDRTRGERSPVQVDRARSTGPSERSDSSRVKRTDTRIEPNRTERITPPTLRETYQPRNFTPPSERSSRDESSSRVTIIGRDGGRDRTPTSSYTPPARSERSSEPVARERYTPPARSERSSEPAVRERYTPPARSERSSEPVVRERYTAPSRSSSVERTQAPSRSRTYSTPPTAPERIEPSPRVESPVRPAVGRPSLSSKRADPTESLRSVRGAGSIGVRRR